MRSRGLAAVVVTGSLLAVGVVAPAPAEGAVLPPCPPGVPEPSTLCSPQTPVLLVEAEELGLGTVAAGRAAPSSSLAAKLGRGAVKLTGLAARILRLDGDPGGPGDGGAPDEQEGWVPYRTVTKNQSATTLTVTQAPAWRTAGTFVLDWETTWYGEWTEPSGVPDFGVTMSCRSDGGILDNWRMTHGILSSRGSHPGGPGTSGYQGNGTITIDTSLCGPGLYFDHVMVHDFTNYGVETRYYPPGHPLRSPQGPSQEPSGKGTLNRRVHCIDASGVVTTITDSWTGDLSAEGTHQLAALTCPDGSVAGGAGIGWEPEDGGPGSDVVPDYEVPPWVRDLPRLYPQCFAAGADCRLELWDVSGADALWCGILAVDCPLWYVSPTRASDYQCRWGPYPIELSFCSALRDPGKARPNGHLDDDGQPVPEDFPPLELDSEAVATLISRLTERYPTGDTACEVLGEHVRAVRGDAPVIIPDVVWDCTTYGILDALYFIAASGGATGLEVAVAALTRAVDSPTPDTHPDCDQLSADGTCADPSGRTVGIGGRTWATGPKPRPDRWTSPTPLQVSTVMDTCTEMVRQGYPSLTDEQAQDKCRTEPIFVPGGRAGWGYEAAVHDLDVITDHPSLVGLQYTSGANKKTAGVNHGWYRAERYFAPCKDKTGLDENGKDTGKQCDEYPFYTSVEGGPTAYNTYGQDVLRAVDTLDNRLEGSALNAMYTDARCAMKPAVLNAAGVVSPGSTYLVVPLPEVDVSSFYLCPSMARDAFAREIMGGWGSADTGGGWTHTGGASKFSVAGGYGRVEVASGMTFTSTLGSVPSDATDVTLALGADKVPGGGGSYQIIQSRRLSAGEYYGARVKLTTDGVQLHLERSGTILTGGAVAGLDFAAGDEIRVRVQTFGVSPTTLQAKVWEAGTPEPAAWAASVTDSDANLQVPGAVGLSTYLSASAANSPVTFAYGDLAVRPLQGDYSPPPEPGVSARDTFARSLVKGWGPADIGGDWTHAGGVSKFSVADGKGKVEVASGMTFTSTLGSVLSDATDVTLALGADKVPGGGGSYQIVQSRRLSAGEYYGARVKLTTDGVQLHLERSGTILTGGAVAGLDFAAGDEIRVRVQTFGVSPTTLQAKVWKAGTPEPAAWTWSVIDFEPGLQAPGAVGLSTYLSASAANSPVTFSYSDLAVAEPGRIVAD